MYDRHLDAGLKQVRNWRHRPYIHSTMIDAIAPPKFDGAIPLHIGNGKIFMAYSARLVKLIPGRALHYLDFVDQRNPLTRKQVEGIANDLAQWLFTLHHDISTGAMVANKIEQQFADTGRTLTDSAVTTEKYKLFVINNMREITTLREHMQKGSMNADYQGRIEMNMAAAGVDFNLLAQTAECLSKRLPQVMTLDRFGLTHSDVHPANIIVNSRRDCVHGICDWMTGTVTAQSVDFAGLGLARGLLPKVVAAYRKIEEQRRVDLRINIEAVYAFAAMRQIFVTVKALKNGYLEGTTARIAWEQVQESMLALSKIKPDMYGDLARKYRRLRLPRLKLPTHRSTLASHPSLPLP